MTYLINLKKRNNKTCFSKKVSKSCKKNLVMQMSNWSKKSLQCEWVNRRLINWIWKCKNFRVLTTSFGFSSLNFKTSWTNVIWLLRIKLLTLKANLCNWTKSCKIRWHRFQMLKFKWTTKYSSSNSNWVKKKIKLMKEKGIRAVYKKSWWQLNESWFSWKSQTSTNFRA